MFSLCSDVCTRAQHTLYVYNLDGAFKMLKRAQRQLHGNMASDFDSHMTSVSHRAGNIQAAAVACRAEDWLCVVETLIVCCV